MTTSRKVSGYIKAVQKRDKLRRLCEEAEAEVKMRLGTLTGGQLAQARRELQP